MTRKQATEYHVLLEGRSMGPYDRRTIVGMRIRKTLSSDNLLIDNHGVRLTEGDLLAERVSQNGFNANGSGVFSLVQGTYAASLLGVQGRGFAIPAFKGEIEARVQGDVLRIAGRHRKGLGWKEDRVKIPLTAFVHARLVGTRVDLWLRSESARPGDALQRMSLELFSAESAAELVDWLPGATPPPPALAGSGAATAASGYLPWLVVIGVVAVLVLVALVLAFGSVL